MHLEAHLFFKFSAITGIVVVPELQRRGAGLLPAIREVRAQLFFGGGFVVVGEVAQEEEGEHVVAEIVGVHGSAKLVGNAPEGSAHLFLVLFGHD